MGNWAKNKGLLWKVFVPMVTSPLAGFLLGVTMMLLLWAIIAGMARSGGVLRRLARPRWVNAFFGKAQILSAAYMGFAHGHNDAQKTMGIIALTWSAPNRPDTWTTCRAGWPSCTRARAGVRASRCGSC